MISVSHLKKSYLTGNCDVLALNDISFRIDRGEFVAIIGKSGSGKSTLMNILGCLDVPTSGKYLLNGRDVSALSKRRLSEIRNREIGFIFQGFNLLERMNAVENVELPLIYAGLPSGKRREAAIRALERVGLADRLRHRPSQLSGGQQQRVAIARAITRAPSVILADEPTGNLDAASGHEVLEILSGLNRGGATVILITHDASVAAAAGRVIEISDGKIK